MARRISLTVIALAVFSPAAGGITSPNATPGKYRNCKSLNAKYPHGVGRVGARDKTSGVPVTNFKRSNRLYRLNEGRDRDKDGIACEKR
jgi:Excalibur calcium-binding domain